MKELITTIISSLVDDVQNLSVTEVEGEATNVIEVKAAKEDVGKIIGKEGRNARSIRTIMRAASKKFNKKYILNIL